MNLFEALEENNFNVQLKKGTKVEEEHKDLFLFLSNYLHNNDVKMPLTDKEFYAWIAKDHLNESKKWKNPNYYDGLEDMEERLRSGD